MVCYFCAKNIQYVSYRDIPTLKNYLGSTGKIIPAAETGNCAKCQRKVKRAIKQARILALLPMMVR